jgi:hypothetical protein
MILIFFCNFFQAIFKKTDPANQCEIVHIVDVLALEIFILFQLEVAE